MILCAKFREERIACFSTLPTISTNSVGKEKKKGKLRDREVQGRGEEERRVINYGRGIKDALRG